MPTNTIAEHEKRLMILEGIIEDLDFKGKEYSKQDLLNQLKKNGHSISKSTLNRDLEELSSNNKFVENIGMYYSKYMEDISKTLERVKREAWSIYDKPWTQSKTVIKKIASKNKNKNIKKGQIDQIIREETTTQEIAGPKLGALKLIAEIEKQR